MIGFEKVQIFRQKRHWCQTNRCKIRILRAVVVAITSHRKGFILASRHNIGRCRFYCGDRWAIIAAISAFKCDRSCRTALEQHAHCSLAKHIHLFGASAIERATGRFVYAFEHGVKITRHLLVCVAGRRQPSLTRFLFFPFFSKPYIYHPLWRILR